MNHREPVFIAGAGRVGCALAIALQRAQWPVVGLWNRGEEGAARAVAWTGLSCSSGSPPERATGAAIVIIAVSDAAVHEVAGAFLESGGLQGARVVLHCGGFTPSHRALGCLSPLMSVGTLHPLLSVADPARGAQALRGAAVGLEGSPEAVAAARSLALALGARSVDLRPSTMALYHAAAVMASNHAVALWCQARDLFISAGLDPTEITSLMLPLLRSTVENVANLGLPQALTGPLRRADTEAVTTQLRLLEQGAPEAAALYRAGTRAALEAALQLVEGPEARDRLLRFRRDLDLSVSP